jgi:hypothetical protein
MEDRDDYEIDDRQQKPTGSKYGDIPSMSSGYTRMDSTEIEPVGTGCRTLVIFILLISLVLGGIYIYKQSQPPVQPAPTNAPPGQTRQ